MLICCKHILFLQHYMLVKQYAVSLTVETICLYIFQVGLQSLNLGICPKLNSLHIVAARMVLLELKGCGVLSEASINCPLLTSLDASFCRYCHVGSLCIGISYTLSFRYIADSKFGFSIMRKLIIPMFLVQSTDR